MDTSESGISEEPVAQQGVEQQRIVSPTPAEKLLSQSEVNEIVGKVRHAGYEKGRKDGMAETKESAISNPQLTEDQIRQMMREEASKVQEDQFRQQAAHHLLSEFSTKMAAGKERYPDFEEKVAGLDLAKIPQIIQLANATDNTADVMYELANKPYKVGNILSLLNSAPHLAIAEMQNLSNSIKTNQKAAQTVSSAREPLSNLRPSNAGIDNGVKSVGDFRKMPCLMR